jgi:dihydroneopterin aldolase
LLDAAPAVLLDVSSEVKQVMEGPPRALQERLAEEMCQRLLQMDTRVTAVKVSQP